MRNILLAISSSLLLILSFPKFDIEFLAWFAIVPLFIAIRNKSLKFAFALTYLTGISEYIGGFYWISVPKGVTWIDFFLWGIYQASYYGLFGLAFNFTSKKTKLPTMITAPLLWVSLEYLRSHAGFLGTPWALLGHSQYLTLPIIQISSFTGAYGVSFLIVMVNAALYEVIQKRFRAFKPAIATLCILGISLFYGLMVLTKEPAGDKVSVTVVQGNIPQDLKWKREFKKQHLNQHIRLTKKASDNSNTSLIIWPEAAVPGFLRQNLDLTQTLSGVAEEVNTPLLVGSSHRPKFGDREFRRKNSFNSAFLILPKKPIGEPYNKIRLLPFSEYLPLKDLFPWPSRFIFRAGVEIPGKEYTIFNVNEAKFGVTICWENIFPEVFSQFVKKGANFMINITNEAWFGETAAPYQFLAMSVFRAVENRRSIARSANTGISGFIDPHGRILGRVKNHNKDIFVEGYLTMEIPLSNEKTFYTKYGDVFAYMNLIAAIFMLGLSVKEVLAGRHKTTKVCTIKA